jgi:hypothetical protein
VPRLLVERFAEDSIGQFRSSALIRNEDAWVLYYRGHFTAAIYLWGYVVEMTLKSAWFSNVLDYDDNHSIDYKDFRIARDQAKQYNIKLANYHNLTGWAQLLIRHRIEIGRVYPDPSFGSLIQIQSQKIYSRWREFLRYKKNRAYHSEAITVAETTQWFLANSKIL